MDWNLEFTIVDSHQVDPTTEIGICWSEVTKKDIYSDTIQSKETMFYYRNVLESVEDEAEILHEYINSNGSTLLVPPRKFQNIFSNLVTTSSGCCWDCSKNIPSGYIVYSNPLGKDSVSQEKMCHSCLENMITELCEYYKENKYEITAKLV